jgi:ribosomal protein S18 acetylase RimI-like enzyme
MVRTEQWNVTKEDLARLREYEPHGCFVAEVEGVPAGHVFSISYEKLGWIGILIIRSRYRRRGIGESLTLRAKQYLQSVGAETIKLDAVPEISELYRNIGFVNECDSLRFEGYSGRARLYQSQNISPFNEEIIGKIAEFDARYFGATRERVIRKLYGAFPSTCFVATSKPEVIGYIMCRKADRGYNLGPWVCMPEKGNVAADLLAACLKQINPTEPVYVGVPETNKLAKLILRRLGFSQYSKAIRMTFGQKLQNERAQGILGIGGPMKG